MITASVTPLSAIANRLFLRKNHSADSNASSVVTKRDLTYILGDVTMEKSAPYLLLDRMNGRKKVVLGNHDLPKHVPDLLQHVEQVGALMRYKGIWMSHCPIHPMELDYRVQRIIHGHIHEKQVMIDAPMAPFEIPDDRYICVSCERVDYTPKTLQELGINR